MNQTRRNQLLDLKNGKEKVRYALAILVLLSIPIFISFSFYLKGIKCIEAGKKDPFSQLATILKIKQKCIKPTIIQPPVSGRTSEKPKAYRISQESLYFSEYSDDEDLLRIYSVNYDGSNKKMMVELSDTNIKALQVLSPDVLLYLGNLDGMGRGDGVYKLSDAGETKFIPVPEGFIFDQMYLSPDKEKLVVWEFEDKFFLKESISRVVVYENIKLEPKRRVLVEQMGSSGEVYYPVFWDKGSKIIFLDTLDPNGGGLFHGFYTVNTRDAKTDLLFEDGTYSSIPVLSPNGEKLAYTLYDSSIPRVTSSSATKLSPVNVINPNGLVVYDIESKGVKRLGVDLQSLYFNLAWGPNDMLAVKVNKPLIDKNELVIINVSTGDILYQVESQAGVFAFLDKGKISLGNRLEGFSGTGIFSGNPLPVQGVYLYDLDNKTYEKVYSDRPIQILN